MTAIARMWLVMAGTAALSLATIVDAVGPSPAGVLPLGAALFVVLTVWSVLARSRAERDSAPSGRTGLLALASAAGIALADRHLVVASRGLAPDDLAVALLAAVCVALAVRAPALGGRPLVTGLALAAYALICLSLIGGTRYHSDAVANVHRAAELVLSGADPYRALDTYESLERFGLDRALATHLEDGTALRSFNYPALSFLVPAPAVALGLADLRVLYAGLVVVAALAATALCAAPWRPYVLASAIGNVVVARQHVLAGIDPTWGLLLGACLVVLSRARGRWRRLAVSAVLLGLAAASRQPAWFAVPLVIPLVAHAHGIRAALRYSGLALVAFAAPALPFLVGSPASYIGGISAPIVLPLEPHGIGLVRLGTDGVLPLLPRGVYLGLALAALGAALVAALLRRPALIGLPALAIAPLYLGWRALQNYFAFGGLFAALAVADDDARARRRLSTESEVSDAGR